MLSAFYPYRGGIAQFGAQLYRALENEHEVRAYTFKRQYPGLLFPGKTQFVSEGDPADEIPANRLLDSVGPWTFAKTARKIATQQPDVVISQYWMTFFAPSFARVHRKLKSTKRVSILHNVIPHEKRFFDKKANQMFLKQNDGFIVMSDKVLNDLLSLKPDAKYLRMDHPVYDQFGEKIARETALDRLGLAPDKKYLLFFGFIRDYKGLDVLLKSLLQVDSDVHLIVAGEVYGDFQKYDQLLDEHQLRDRVHCFTDYIPDEKVTDFFSAADACVLPYKSATQSGITAIAGHFEVPMIITDVGGLKESIQDGVNGLVVDKPEPELVAKSVNRFYQEQLKEHLSRGMKAWREEHSWENFASELVRFIESL